MCDWKGGGGWAQNQGVAGQFSVSARLSESHRAQGLWGHSQEWGGKGYTHLQGVWSSHWPCTFLPTRLLSHLLEEASSPESSILNRLESCLVLCCCSLKGKLPEPRPKCVTHIRCSPPAAASQPQSLAPTQPSASSYLTRVWKERRKHSHGAQGTVFAGRKPVRKGWMAVLCSIIPGRPSTRPTCKDTLSAGFLLSSHEVEFRSLVPFASDPSPFPRSCLWPLRASNWNFKPQIPESHAFSRVPCTPARRKLLVGGALTDFDTQAWDDLCLWKGYDPLALEATRRQFE